MQLIARTLSPSATDLLRADHTRVLAAFHRYHHEMSPRMKRGIVETIGVALEVHAQVEEELLYPAMRAADTELVEKSIPEHDDMRTHIAALRGMEAGSHEFDETFFELMHAVMHHVADEETRLFPDAERLLGGRLAQLGVRMARRRLQLGAPRAAEMARNLGRRVPPGAMLAAFIGVLAGALVYRQALRR